MRLTHGNLVKAMYLVLFLLSSLLCLFKPSTHSGLVAILSLVGFIAFDVICQIKGKSVPDLSKEVASLEAQNAKIEKDFQVIKDNISTVSAAGLFKRK